MERWDRWMVILGGSKFQNRFRFRMAQEEPEFQGKTKVTGKKSKVTENTTTFANLTRPSPEKGRERERVQYSLGKLHFL